MKILAALVLSIGFVFGQPAWALETDRKHHGPLDGHAVMVFDVAKQIDLPDAKLAEVKRIAERSQADWRAWFKTNRAKVDAFQKKIQELKVSGDKAALKKVLADKKKFMHTAPSLLREPEPIKKVLTAEEYAAFSQKLEALKKALHNPKGKKQAGKG